MKIAVLSMNYQTAPIELLEACSCNKDDVTDYLNQLISTIFFDEMVVLSTCNRTEWTFIGPDPEKAMSVLIDAITEKSMVAKSILDKHSVQYIGIDAIAHLFQVACGLKSMLIKLTTNPTDKIGIKIRITLTPAERNANTSKSALNRPITNMVANNIAIGNVTDIIPGNL